MKQLGLALVLLAPAAAAQQAQLLGSGEVVDFSAASAFAAEARVSVLFTNVPAFGARGPGFRFTVLRSNPGAVIGRTEVLDASDGPMFFAAMEFLTNGRPGSVTSQVVMPGAGGFASGTSEADFFDFSGLACPNGIDFAGAQIQRIELRVDGVFFGAGPLGQSTLIWRGTLSVFGFDTTCASSVSGALGASRAASSLQRDPRLVSDELRCVPRARSAD